MPTLTLYQLEDQLAALADSVELVEPAQEEQFIAEFSAALKAAVAKRDRVGEFLAHLDSQIEFRKSEEGRIAEGRRSLERVRDRVEGYVQRTIESQGFDDSGRYRKLEGNSVTFSLRPCPPSVKILDEEQVPIEYKRYTLQMPAALWEEITTLFDARMEAKIQQHVALKEVSIDKRSIKTDLDTDWDIPGVDLAIGQFSLVRK